MNILILHNSLDYNKSGVERVSFLLKKELKDRGYNCYEGCTKGENFNHKEDVFEYNFNDSKQNASKGLVAFVEKYHIQIIIIQGLFDPEMFLQNHFLPTQCAISICKKNTSFVF